MGTAHAQTEAAEGRWSVGAAGWAGAAYRSLLNTDGSELAERIIAGRDDRERPELTMGGGFHAAYRLSHRFSLEAGVDYARFGYAYAVDLSDLTFGDMIDPRRGFVYNTGDPALPASLRFIDRFHYLEARIGAVMEFGKGRWRSSTALGVAPAFLLTAQGITISEYSDGRVERESFEPLEEFSSFNLIPYFSTGLTMHPGGRWHWSLRPTLRYGLLQIIDAPVSGRLYSATLDLGVRFCIGK